MARKEISLRSCGIKREGEFSVIESEERILWFGVCTSRHEGGRGDAFRGEKA
jgi:hypothetical protein